MSTTVLCKKKQLEYRGIQKKLKKKEMVLMTEEIERLQQIWNNIDKNSLNNVWLFLFEKNHKRKESENIFLIGQSCGRGNGGDGEEKKRGKRGEWGWRERISDIKKTGFFFQNSWHYCRLIIAEIGNFFKAILQKLTFLT